MRFQRVAAPAILVSILLLSGGILMAGGPSEKIPPVPTPGMVTMVDLGAGRCIPCKMMAPIIEELKKEYAGRASIVFIDVWENRDQSARFGISGIPTQIFYDKKGKEVSRHMGFLDKESIIAIFQKLGVSSRPGKK